ncbi:zf-ZPR1-domain-containing protein [Schizopora paradoxa]|uniref:Zf-ZPR1-domain-containing protein n=1 Tax=Schizopora paradoxa TaxID=27342 RepID=A0A0H2RIQ9_9AGAM|nr:zf-ZPR1-domain-containing protein [Schizopora paradoxa]
MSATNQELFPAIGTIAEQTDQLPDDLKDKDAPAVTVPEYDEERPVQEVESLCMRCGKNGTSRLLLTSIPYFREVVLMSFRCEHCGEENNEVQSAGTIKEHGAVYTVRVLDRADLDRQLVKSPTCTVIIPEFELTIPPQKGQLTTIEGLLRDVASDLGAGQPLRRVEAEDAYKKIQSILDGINGILADSDDEDDKEASSSLTKKASTKDAPMQPFTVKLDDPAGNSFLEFHESMADPKWNLRTYPRSLKQNIELGLVDGDVVDEKPKDTAAPTRLSDKSKLDSLLETAEENPNDEIFVFSGTCSSCGAPLDTMMKKVTIPYFKDIIIMSTNCDKCGYRDNEVKSGSAISEKGKRITLKVEDSEDLSRDILKSESCGLSIPEIELVLQPGTLGGRFTTLEGLLDQVYEELSDKLLMSGDSMTNDRQVFVKFLANLKAVKNAERPFTLVLEDPLANSYLQNIYAPDPDPNMTTETFDRTWEQNEDLGLNDMKVEGYETPEPTDDKGQARVEEPTEKNQVNDSAV